MDSTAVPPSCSVLQRLASATDSTHCCPAAMHCISTALAGAMRYSENVSANLLAVTRMPLQCTCLPDAPLTLGTLKVVGHRQAATATRTTFPGGPKSQKPMDGRQKQFCGENKVDSPLGFCSPMPKTPRIFGSDNQNDEFLGF